MWWFPYHGHLLDSLSLIKIKGISICRNEEFHKTPRCPQGWAFLLIGSINCFLQSTLYLPLTSPPQLLALTVACAVLLALVLALYLISVWNFTPIKINCLFISWCHYLWKIPCQRKNLPSHWKRGRNAACCFSVWLSVRSSGCGGSTCKGVGGDGCVLYWGMEIPVEVGVLVTKAFEMLSMVNYNAKAIWHHTELSYCVPRSLI